MLSWGRTGSSASACSYPEAGHWFAPLFLTLGVIGITYGAIVATMQHDLKRLVAYSSIAHLGFIILGTFALTNQGLTGGVMQMVNHGVSTGAVFLLVGMISERRHAPPGRGAQGLQTVALSSPPSSRSSCCRPLGLPGLNGFVGEFLVLIGSFLTARWWTVVAATGVILAALYLLWAYQRVFHGPVDDANREFREITLREPGHAAAGRHHRLHRPLPEADAQPDRAERRAPGDACRGAQRLRPTGRGSRGGRLT